MPYWAEDYDSPTSLRGFFGASLAHNSQTYSQRELPNWSSFNVVDVLEETLHHMACIKTPVELHSGINRLKYYPKKPEPVGLDLFFSMNRMLKIIIPGELESIY